MDNIEKQFAARPEKELSPEKKLEEFRSMIGRVKEEEMRKKAEWEERGRKGPAYDPHFDAIDPEALNLDDVEIFKKLKDKTLTREEFDAQREKISQERTKNKSDIFTDPRSNFYMYMTNEITGDEELIKKWGLDRRK